MNAIPKGAWADSVRAISKEAAGAIRMEIVQPADIPELMLAALGGNADEVAPFTWTVSGLGGQQFGLHVLLIANGRAVVQGGV